MREKKCTDGKLTGMNRSKKKGQMKIDSEK